MEENDRRCSNCLHWITVNSPPEGPGLGWCKREFGSTTGYYESTCDQFEPIENEVKPIKSCARCFYYGLHPDSPKSNKRFCSKYGVSISPNRRSCYQFELQKSKETTMLKPKDVVNNLTTMLNNMCSENDEKEFVAALMCEHRTLQQKTARLFLQCFVEWAGAADKKMFDDRNKKTVEVASSIIPVLEMENVLIKDRVFLPYI